MCPAHPMKKIIISLISFYKRIPLPTHSACRFTPTCSEYTLQAVQKYGSIKGVWLGARRVLRCNPFNPGGEDPVS